jgi:hypothetical protein
VADEDDDVRSIDGLAVHVAVLASSEAVGVRRQARPCGLVSRAIPGMRLSSRTVTAAMSKVMVDSCHEVVVVLSEDLPGWREDDEMERETVTNTGTTALVTGAGHGYARGAGAGRGGAGDVSVFAAEASDAAAGASAVFDSHIVVAIQLDVMSELPRRPH